jgi:putative PIG3 family NAD(P)H quinone oxidoreductase
MMEVRKNQIEGVDWMKAWILNQAGGPEHFELGEIDKPKAQAGEALVKVKAIGLNRHDVMSREGLKADASIEDRVIGIEISGEVVDINLADGESSHVAIGDHVAGIITHGAYAEYARLPLSRAMVFPKDTPYTTSAAIPEAFMTAYQTMYWIGELQEGERILVHAASSGVGTAAIQLANHLSHAEIYATAGRQDKLDLAKELGAKTTINYKEENFADVIAEATDKKGVDVILDFIGASYASKNVSAIGQDGRWVLIGALGGTEVPDFEIGQLLFKRLKLQGTLLSPRSDDYKARLVNEVNENVVPLIADGTIQPVIDTIMDFDSIPDAHRYMEDNKNLGKIMISLEK